MYTIEPGILSVTRWFLGLMWVLLSCGVLANLGEGRLPPAAFFYWLMSGAVFLYLLWNWLQRQLGAWYMPLALLVLSAGPIAIHWADTLLNMMRGTVGPGALSDQGAAYFWLLLPLLVISSQYRMMHMFAFTLGTSLLAIGLFLPVAIIGGPPLSATSDDAILRFFLFSIVGAIVVRVTQAQRRHRYELTRENARLVEYAATREQLAISRERNRLARELHDTLAHTMSAVTVQLGAVDALMEVDPASARAKLNETRQLARSGLNEARRALHALRAQPLEDLGLPLAIQHLAKQTADRAGLALTLSMPEHGPDWTTSREQSVYRLAEEAFNNVLRHAQATHLRVMLWHDSAEVGLRIQDNGQGFDPSAIPPTGHYGLLGMRERAALIGGQLRVESQPGQGTCIELRVPNKTEQGL